MVVGLSWYVAGPLRTRLCGSLTCQRIGLGEDLPAAAARQWARWGKRTNFCADDFRRRDGFVRFDAPWLALRATDDDITTPENAQGLYEMYPYAKLEERVLDPKAFGKSSIGHLAFFRSQNADLWSIASDWFRTLARKRAN